MLTPHDLSESIVEWYRSIEHMFIGLSEYRSFIVRLSDITIGLSSRGSGQNFSASRRAKVGCHIFVSRYPGHPGRETTLKQ